MKVKFIIFYFPIILLFIPLFGLTEINRTPKDFFLVTIPKSGTHLNTKLLMMLTGREPRAVKHHFGEGVVPSYKQFEDMFLYFRQNNCFAYQHLYGVSNYLFGHFARIHPEYVKLLAIRDLRDVFVSLVYYWDKTYPNEWKKYGLSPDEPFEKKLNLAISSLIQEEIINAFRWYQDPNTVIIRYEDIIGQQGGGDPSSQKEAISHLANALNIYLTDELLDNITKNLFGISSGPNLPSTFFNGKIGKWKSKFNEEHIKIFNKKWGKYQMAFGYPLAE